MRQRTFFRLALVGAAFPAVALMSAGPALAASDVTVTNTETVQVHLDATGKLKDASVYDQLAFTGHGTVDVADPVSTKNLRNLDGFGGFDVKDGKLVTSVDVSGEKRLRTISDFDKQVPLTIEAVYLLDGKQVEPGDVVGRSGDLEVRYTVTNVTAKSAPVTFDDGTGQQVTKDVDVVIPMVGSLSTTLPSTFTDVTSAEANMAGDGRGGTKLSFTMTLFGPIGSPTAKFGYTARISDGLVPPASISALPVSPLDSPSFKGGAASYKGGADTGLQLTDGATQIDENLLKLRDGAGQLLAGLIQLRDGASKLNDGLAGEAAPGAAKLADGAAQVSGGADELNAGLYKIDQGASKLSVGAGQLSDGTGKLKAGANQLVEGSDDAADGAVDLAIGSGQVADGLDEANSQAPALIGGLRQVSDGLEDVDAGLAQLYGGIGQLPASAQALHDGIGQLTQGIGSESTPGTLLYGVDQVRTGLSAAVAAGGSADQLKGGTDQVKSGLDDALEAGGAIDDLAAAIDAARATAGCTTDLVCAGTLAAAYAGVNTDLRDDTQAGSQGLGQVSAGLAQLKTSLTTAVTGLTQVQCGLDNTQLSACDPDRRGLLQGVALADAGVTQLVDGVVAQVQGAVGHAGDTKADHTLRGGVNSLGAGVDQIDAGGRTLIEGLGLLGDGAGQVADGNSDLAVGLDQLAGGAGRLADGVSDADSGAKQVSGGASQLAAGADDASAGGSKLADGSEQLATGANDLSSGLTDAANGSGDLADGLVEAAGKAPALEAGAQQLSRDGSKKLIVAGKATSADYGEKYALITAGAERAKSEGMAYGAPEGATGGTAYSIEMAGADGESGRNLGRGLGALALFGIGAGAAAVIRQRLA